MRLMAVAFVAAFAAGAHTRRPCTVPIRACSALEPMQPGSTTIITRDEFGRTRTRIMVQKRSYLDGGTEVMPADNIDGFRFSVHGAQAVERARQDRVRPAGLVERSVLPAGQAQPLSLAGRLGAAEPSRRDRASNATGYRHAAFCFGTWLPPFELRSVRRNRLRTGSRTGATG